MLLSEGAKKPGPSNPGRKGVISGRTRGAMIWLYAWATKHEKMPNSRTICLPIAYTKFDIYKLYRDETEAELAKEKESRLMTEAEMKRLKPISYHHFCQAWAKKYGFIIIPKVS